MVSASGEAPAPAAALFGDDQQRAPAPMRERGGAPVVEAVLHLAVRHVRSTRMTTMSATTPMGTLTRKTQRQPSMPEERAAPAKNPPITGPERRWRRPRPP